LLLGLDFVELPLLALFPWLLLLIIRVVDGFKFEIILVDVIAEFVVANESLIGEVV
jgi:hypothetical protein